MSDQTPKARPNDSSGPSGASPRPAGADGQGPDGPGFGARSAPEPARGGGRLTWLIPTLTFLVGLLLGALVVGASGLGDDTAETATPDPTATDPLTSPTTGTTDDRPDATVTVPAACLDAAEGTQGMITLVQEAATAAQELNAAELSSIVRQMQESQSTLEAASSACRSAAGGETGSDAGSATTTGPTASD